MGGDEGGHGQRARKPVWVWVDTDHCGLETMSFWVQHGAVADGSFVSTVQCPLWWVVLKLSCKLEISEETLIFVKKSSKCYLFFYWKSVSVMFKQLLVIFCFSTLFNQTLQNDKRYQKLFNRRKQVLLIFNRHMQIQESHKKYCEMCECG